MTLINGYPFAKDPLMLPVIFYRFPTGFLGFSVLLNLFFCLFAGTLSAQTAMTLGENWPLKQQVKVTEIDHTSWNQLLQKYVDKDGRVNYKAWKQSKMDRTRLEKYLNNLSRKRPESISNARGAVKDAELAFWINAYNALTIDGMLRVYPTTSIRNHTAKLWGYNIWKQHKLKVGSKAYSLDDIEHKILRKKSEPRIHFAIVCASIGCPRLLNQAYVGKSINQQLDSNAVDFFSRKQNYRLDKANNKVYLSSIIKWFGSDFGASQAEQLRKISKFVPKADQEILRKGRPSISYLNYDWNINKQ